MVARGESTAETMIMVIVRGVDEYFAGKNGQPQGTYMEMVSHLPRSTLFHNAVNDGCMTLNIIWFPVQQQQRPEAPRST